MTTRTRHTLPLDATWIGELIDSLPSWEARPLTRTPFYREFIEAD